MKNDVFLANVYYDFNANGHFTPYRSTTYPAGTCRNAYDQKNADCNAPTSWLFRWNNCRNSGSVSAAVMFDRSTYEMIMPRNNRPTTDHRCAGVKGFVLMESKCTVKISHLPELKHQTGKCLLPRWLSAATMAS